MYSLNNEHMLKEILLDRDKPRKGITVHKYFREYIYKRKFNDTDKMTIEQLSAKIVYEISD